MKEARDQWLATVFLLGGTCAKYSQLVADLQNSNILGADKYLHDIEEAYDLMLDYSPLVGSSSNIEKNTRDLYTTGVSLYQALNSVQQQQENNSNKPHEIISGTNEKSSKISSVF